MREDGTNSKWLKNFLTSLEDNLAQMKAEGYHITAVIVSTDLNKRLTEEYGYQVADLLGYVVQLDDEMLDGNVKMELGFLSNPLQ